jgi:23S rRNA (cytosine1962-C5)-methyltransferase
MEAALSRIVLKPRKVRTFLSRHPWVLDSSIDRVEGEPADGDELDVVSDKGRFLARGFYNSKSRIRVRLYTWTPGETLDGPFWRRRLETALALRRLIGYDDPQGAARLVFSEGDGLSGLVVDRYADCLVVQATALGVARRLPEIVPALVELVKPRCVAVRVERAMAKQEGIEIEEGVCWGEPPAGPLVIAEHSLRWQVDLNQGQKTGFYLDQKENRRAAAGYLRGRRVLDMFCYHGGFSLAARAWGEARECIGYDSSSKAVEQAQANAAFNGISGVRFEAGEGFEVLESLVAAGERFGGIVLDPPKFARSKGKLEDALRAYHWLNRLAMLLLEPGGVLVTCSCSGAVGREDFFYMLLGAAQQAGRQLQVLEQRGASADHPVAANCPESEYLKCFICRVI